MSSFEAQSSMVFSGQSQKMLTVDACRDAKTSQSWTSYVCVNQWRFQVPIYGTLYKAYVRVKIQGICLHFLWLYMVKSNYLNFRVFKFTLNKCTHLQNFDRC
jgi:hypothetical protein